MGKFEVGQKVRASAEALTDHYGMIGTIIEVRADGEAMRVKFDDGIIEGFMRWELVAPAATPALPAAAGDATSQPEFERGWDAATYSMLDIMERAIDVPVGDALTHVKLLLENFRRTYPKHGKYQDAAAIATKYQIGEEVIILDGTSLVGKVIARSRTADAYKVAISDTDTGEWYGADDLAAK